MSKSAPAAPDYTGAAQQTAQASKNVTEQQTFANRPDINTPWSQQTWAQTPTWDPTTGQYLNKWTQNTNLTPGAQSALDSQVAVTGGLSSTAQQLLGQNNQQLTQPLDWSSFQATGAAPTAQNYQNPNLQTSLPDSSGGYANKAADAAWKQYNDRNQPIQQTQTDNLRTQLYNSGLKEGDPGYDAAMKRLSQNQGDANTQASLAATQTGIQGGAIMQGQDLAAGGFANSAANTNYQNTLAGGAQTYNQQTTSANYQNTLRQQQISEDLQKRGFTLNEISSLLNGQQVSAGAQPNFNAAGVSSGANYANAAADQYAAATNQSNVNNANTQGAVGAGLGVAAIAV